MTNYQVNSSDIRLIGAAQFGATITAAAGTWALTNYLDVSRDIVLLEVQKLQIPPGLQGFADINFVLWIIFWLVGGAALIWQGCEYRRIMVEHGQPTVPQKLRRWWTGR